MTTMPLRTNATPAGGLMENVLIKGDLSKLTPQERSNYYLKVCESVGLNPLTKPFEYITLNGKLTLYALRNCTDQLRTLHNVSVDDLTESERDGVFIVTAKVRNGEGRTDIAKGAVSITGLKGEALANSLMRAETKAKRRATLSLCGLGFLDETEIETIPAAARGPRMAPMPAPLTMAKFEAVEPHDPDTGEIADERVPEPGAAEARLPPTPSAAEYLEHWDDIIERATSAAHGAQMAKQWNDEKQLRDRMLWPDEEMFPALQKRVRAAVKFLKDENAALE